MSWPQMRVRIRLGARVKVWVVVGKGLAPGELRGGQGIVDVIEPGIGEVGERDFAESLPDSN